MLSRFFFVVMLRILRLVVRAVVRPLARYERPLLLLAPFAYPEDRERGTLFVDRRRRYVFDMYVRAEAI